MVYNHNFCILLWICLFKNTHRCSNDSNKLELITVAIQPTWYLLEILMKPDGKLSEKLHFTQSNLQFCVQNELKAIANNFMEPFILRAISRY